MNIRKFEAIVFDLDGTLHDNDLYWHGAFADISAHFEKKFRTSADLALRFLTRRYAVEGNHYGLLFDDLYQCLATGSPNLKSIPSDAFVRECLELFHAHMPRLRIFSDAFALLKQFQSKYKLGIITNGRESTQLKKIRALGIQSYFDAIVCPSKDQSKPSEKPYLEIARHLNVSMNDMVYVGDDPENDFSGIRHLPILTVRLLRGRYKTSKVPKEQDAEYAIRSFREFPDLLKQIQTTKRE